jgi:cytosine/uracil/thiamine/allantoin permease
VGYFIADNVDNNNTYINDLFIEFGFNPLYYCLYYIGYIINLIIYILLFNINSSTLNKEKENKNKVIY